MKVVNISDLGLGDVVLLRNGGAYASATVKQIMPNGYVKVIRPYIHCADFSYTGGVITYLGFEEFELTYGTVTLLEKSRPLK